MGTAVGVPDLHSTEIQHFLGTSQECRIADRNIGFTIGGGRTNFLPYYTQNIRRKCHQGTSVYSTGFRNGSENIGMEGNLPPCTIGGLKKILLCKLAQIQRSFTPVLKYAYLTWVEE
jgi:hypothetical protein